MDRERRRKMNDKALSQEPKSIIREAIEDYVCNYLTDTAKAQEILNALQDIEQEPCDDAISREAVLKLKHHKPEYGDMIYAFDVEQLPSVTQKSGEWTDVGLAGEMYVRNCKCTNCGKWNIGSPLELSAYCGICGAKMTSDKYMLYDTEPYKEGDK